MNLKNIAKKIAQITNFDIMQELNKDLELEYAAAIQYIQHAAQIKGAEFFSVQKELIKHSEEEMQHAVKISEWINTLGGISTIDVETRKISEDSIEMLHQDLDGEMDAISRYKNRIGQAEQLGELGLKKDLMEILSEEEEHRRDLEFAIGL
jgi:bacterioferritin